MYNYGTEFTLTARGCNASGVYLPTGEFAVLKGSCIDTQPSTSRFIQRHPGSHKFRQALLSNARRQSLGHDHLDTTLVFETAAKAASVMTGDIRDARAWRPVTP